MSLSCVCWYNWDRSEPGLTGNENHKALNLPRCCRARTIHPEPRCRVHLWPAHPTSQDPAHGKKRKSPRDGKGTYGMGQTSPARRRSPVPIKGSENTQLVPLSRSRRSASHIHFCFAPSTRGSAHRCGSKTHPIKLPVDGSDATGP